MLSGLREKKKQFTQANILKQASLLFQSNGYDGTTMQDVAEACQLGVGTLYNYYQSKSELLLAILGANLNEPLSEFAELVQSSADFGIDKVLKSIQLFTNSLMTQPKSILRDTIKLIITNQDEGTKVAHGILSADSYFLNFVKLCLQKEVERGKLPVGYPIDDALDVFYGVIRSEVLTYILTEEIEMKDVQQKIEKHINFLFQVNK